MKIHEYQGKEILRKFGINVPHGKVIFRVEDAIKVANELGGPIWVLKAQVHAGGRGKSGGIKIATSVNQVYDYAKQLFSSPLITNQTLSKGKQVKSILIEESIKIKKELYLGIIIDRTTQKIVMIGSIKGGVNIEEVALEKPELIHKINIEPINGLSDIEVVKLIQNIGLPHEVLEKTKIIFHCLYRAFWETDALLAEINPLVFDVKNNILALDAKFSFDSNALFRQPEISNYSDIKENSIEFEALKHNLSYISLNGNIGCLVNGAGLAMATMDIIKLFGGEPANFLDVGGGASTEKVTAAFKIMLKNKNIKVILVNIFGGIMRCDIIASGIVAASSIVNIKIPIIVRMKGTYEELGKEIITKSNLDIINVNSMEEAALRAVGIANH